MTLHLTWHGPRWEEKEASMSDTPRTDKNEQHVYVIRGDYGLVSSSFSRDLERELNAAKARIARLEEAGNDMEKHAEALGMGGTGLVRRWKEAKSCPST